jgi:acyl-CoA reductase-like NAD-dependent aldehyde dehydrogenase
MKKVQALKTPIYESMTRSINPGTGELLGEYQRTSIEEVKQMVRKARYAQTRWRAFPLKKRISSVMKFRDYIMDNLDELAETTARDNGKTRVDAMIAEIVPAAMAVTYYCKNAKRFLKDRPLGLGNILMFNKWSTIVRVPWGVVGIIGPWNYPFSIPFSEVVMALLAGNSVLLKTSDETQAIGHLLKRCIDSAGLPDGVFQYVNIPGRFAGDALLEAGLDKLFFTGSVAVGKYLMKKASETLTPLSLELGGNDPMIVLEDADLERSTNGAIWAGLQNAGQSCGGVERIYVHQKVYDRFMNLLKKKVESLRVGYDTDHNTDIGAMTTDRQIKTVEAHIADALRKGAVIYAQSQYPKKSKGQFIPCTVLSDVDHTMDVMRDETFGPVLGVMKFRDIDEAVELANDSYLGLTASVWSKNRRKAMRIGRMIQAGAVTINDHLMSHGLAETPWGGLKQSAIGRSHGDIGFLEMTQPQVIVNDIMPFVKKNFWWLPHSKAVYEGCRGAAEILYGPGIAKRIKGGINLMKVFFRTFTSWK